MELREIGRGFAVGVEVTSEARSESLRPGGGAVRNKSSSEGCVEVDGVEAGLTDSSALSAEKREFLCDSFSLRIATSSFASKASGISDGGSKVYQVCGVEYLVIRPANVGILLRHSPCPVTHVQAKSSLLMRANT